MSLCDSWITEADLVKCGCDTGDLTPLQVNELLFAASQIMYQWTGEQYPGSCTVTERPCGCGCGCGLLTTQWFRMQGNNWGNECCTGLCGCTAESSIGLTYGPVLTATVSIYGVNFTSFSIIPPNLLVRTDGNQWPSCQTYEGTDGWSVTYTYGADPPVLVKLAAQDLVVDLVAACTGGDCKLPSNTISVNRRGVSLTLDANQAGKALPRVGMALSTFGRKGRTDLVIPGKRGIISSGPVGS